MAFALRPGRPVARELTRRARKELKRISSRLLSDQGDEAVHEGRKSVKKVEAILALLHQVGFDAPNSDHKRLRGAKRALSAIRDAQAAIETFDQLKAKFGNRIPEHTAAMLRARLIREKARIVDQAREDGTVARAIDNLRNTHRAAKDWQPSSIELTALPAVWQRSYRASRRAMAAATEQCDAADFHRWRKRVKALWYQLRLAEYMMSDADQEIRAFNTLETGLGDAHNLAALRSVLAADADMSDADAISNVTALAAALEGEYQRRSLHLGQQLHDASPKKFAKDLRRRLRPEGVAPARSAVSAAQGRVRRAFSAMIAGR